MKNFLKKAAIGTLTFTSLAMAPLTFAEDAATVATPKVGIEKQDDKGAAQHLRMMKRAFNLTLDSISGNTLTAHNKNNESFTIDASNAKLTRRFGGASSLDEMSAGDHLVVFGKAESKESRDLVATRVQNVSIHKYHGKVWGVVESVGNDSFVVMNGKSQFTVKVSSDTKFHGNNQRVLNALSDLQVGDRVVIKGVCDDAKKTSQAERVQLLGVKKGGTLKVDKAEDSEK